MFLCVLIWFTLHVPASDAMEAVLRGIQAGAWRFDHRAQSFGELWVVAAQGTYIMLLCACAARDAHPVAHGSWRSPLAGGGMLVVMLPEYGGKPSCA